MSAGRKNLTLLIGIVGGVVLGVLATWLLVTVVPKVGSPPAPVAPQVQPVDESQLSPIAQQGADLFRTRGCTVCHSVDGSESIGPTMRGAFGTERELEDGRVVFADADYMWESIVDPDAKLVKGYLPSMPSYAWFSDEDIEAIVAFITELGD